MGKKRILEATPDSTLAEDDLVLVSSDGGRILTSRLQMAFTCSALAPVLLGRRTGEGVILQLWDDFEDTQTLRSFLYFIRYVRLDYEISGDPSNYLRWKNRLIKLLAFVDKHDADFHMLRSWANRAEAKEAWSAHDAFVFGALTNDIQMCARAVMLPKSETWIADDSEPASHDFFCAIPPQYSFALSQASLCASPGTEAFRDTFVQAVTAALKTRDSPVTLSTSADFAARMYQRWGSKIYH